MDEEKIRIKVKFPNESDGIIELTPGELKWMVDNDHVFIRFDKVRSMSLPLLAQYYKELEQERNQMLRAEVKG